MLSLCRVFANQARTFGITFANFLLVLKNQNVFILLYDILKGEWGYYTQI